MIAIAYYVEGKDAYACKFCDFIVTPRTAQSWRDHILAHHKDIWTLVRLTGMPTYFEKPDYEKANNGGKNLANPNIFVLENEEQIRKW